MGGVGCAANSSVMQNKLLRSPLQPVGLGGGQTIHKKGLLSRYTAGKERVPSGSADLKRSFKAANQRSLMNIKDLLII